MKLSIELRHLVEAARNANRPTDADYLRIFEAIDARVGMAIGLAGTAAIAAAPAAGIRMVTAKSIASAVIALTGLALFYSAARDDAFDVDAPLVDTAVDIAPRSEAAAETAVVESFHSAPAQLEAASAESETEKSKAPSRPHRAAPRFDPLSEEVAILLRAQQDLRGGRVERALMALNEHERKYKNGALAEERTATRVQALCALGRVTEASLQQGKLPPYSMHSESARLVCAKAKPTPAAR